MHTKEGKGVTSLHQNDFTNQVNLYIVPYDFDGSNCGSRKKKEKKNKNNGQAGSL